MFVWFVWTPSEKDEWASQEMWRMQSTGGHQDSKSWDQLAANRHTSSSRGRHSREELVVYFSPSLCLHAYWTSICCLPLLRIRRNHLDLRNWSLNTCLASWPAWCQHSTLADFKDHIFPDRNTQANCVKTQDQVAKTPGRPCSGTAKEATISRHGKIIPRQVTPTQETPR